MIMHLSYSALLVFFFNQPHFYNVVFVVENLLLIFTVIYHYLVIISWLSTEYVGKYYIIV